MIGCLPTQAIAFEWKPGFSRIRLQTQMVTAADECHGARRSRSPILVRPVINVQSSTRHSIKIDNVDRRASPAEASRIYTVTSRRVTGPAAIYGRDDATRTTAHQLLTALTVFRPSPSTPQSQTQPSTSPAVSPPILCIAWSRNSHGIREHARCVQLLWI